VNKTHPTGEITGRISAHPNPIFSWATLRYSCETNDPVGAEVRIAIGPDDQKLVTQAERQNNIEKVTTCSMK